MCLARHELESITDIILIMIIIVIVTIEAHQVQLLKPSWKGNFKPSNPVYLVSSTLSASICTVAGCWHETTKRAFVYHM